MSYKLLFLLSVILSLNFCLVFICFSHIFHVNRKDEAEILPDKKTFKVPNTDNVIEEGKKTPSKYRNITLYNLGKPMKTDIYTASGWPSVSGDAMKALAGKVSTDNIYLMDDEDGHSDDNLETSLDETPTAKGSVKADMVSDKIDVSAYGTAYQAFGGGKEGRDACHAIAALCEVCSIDSLISNFILPLQVS